MADEGGLDIVGAGKLAKAIPQKAWIQLVDTACVTFKSALAPLTATTSGIGRLIEAKFDRLVDAEKILASEMMARATQKVAEGKRKPSGTAKAGIVIAAIEASGSETDAVIRELWSNLVAQEVVHGNVHPEFPKLLARLSASDARLLASIAEKEKDKTAVFRRAIKKFTTSISILGMSVELMPDAGTFALEHLANLGLVYPADQGSTLTYTGKAFIQSVSDSWDGGNAA
jgi:hypothetical protein